MSLEMFYATIGGDYDSVKGRFVTDERTEKFLNMFFDDDTYENLQAALATQDMETAFRCAHTMKGVAREVGLDKVADAAARLTEALRPQADGSPANIDKVPALMEELSSIYDVCLDTREIIAL